MEITGKIRCVLPEQRFTGRNGELVRYGFVIDTGGQYSRAICFNVLGADRWAKLSPNVAVGNEVQVGFDVSSREWSGRWFTQCDAFRVVLVAGSSVQSQQQQVVSQPPTVDTAKKNGDELPF